MVPHRPLRNVFGEFATGVVIVTAKAPSGELIGMTMTSFNSVSLDPALILFSVDQRAYSLGALLNAEGYAVNVLARGQEHLSNRFARALTDKWHGVGYVEGYAEAPLLDGALAHFECAHHACHQGGDHVIFLGRILRFCVHPSSPEPLLFFRGGYRSVSDSQREESEWPLPIHY